MGGFRDVSIRATTDTRFWGTEYAESLYLFESAKHNLTLKEMTAVGISTLDDPLRTTEQIRDAHDYCRSVYYKYLERLTVVLNEMHGLALPKKFWQTVFGIWLFRHISIVYDKFIRLQCINIDNVSITLLHQASYLVPNDHFDYVRYFCNDAGVMQLVSEYFLLFGHRQHPTLDVQDTTFFPRVSAENHHARLITLPPGIIYSEANNERIAGQQHVQIALCSAYYADQVLHELAVQSNGKINAISLPLVTTYDKRLDLHKRLMLSTLPTDNDFERYLVYTLLNSLPKILVEYFRDYHDCYAQYVDSCSHQAIVTECWSSFLPVSIFCAVAKHRSNTALIFQQHGASIQWLDRDILWLEKEAADAFITTGWHGDTANCVSGGFAIRNQIQYQAGETKTKILHVATTRLPYLLSCGEVAPGGPRFVSYLKAVDAFIEEMPQRLREHYVLRPRRAEFFWNTEHAWDVVRRGIRVEAEGDLLPLMHEAKIVVIDHMSTALGEIINSQIPFVMLYFEEFEALSEQYACLFNDLIACGVVHKSSGSALEHLDVIYDKVQHWWQSKPVQDAVRQLRDASLAPAERTVDFLLSLLEGEKMNTAVTAFIRDSSGVFIPPGGHGAFDYSDGSAHENRVLHTLRSVNDVSIFSQELHRNINDWITEYHFSRERHNLLRHIRLHAGMTVLELGCGCGAITRQLGESGAEVTAVEGSLTRAQAAAARCRDLANVKVYCSNFQDIEFREHYDLVTMVGVLEYSPQYFKSKKPIQDCLEIATNVLKPNGVLIIAIENQLGLKYFCGLREDHADIPYFGIEDRYNERTAITFGRQELTEILHSVGLKHVKFHYPFPDYKIPKAVFTEKAFQNKAFKPEEIIRQIESRDYSGELRPAFDEKLVVPVICRNGLMEDLSNSFLVFASKDLDAISACYDNRMLGVVYSTERAPVYNVRTTFVESNDGILVSKKHLLPGGIPVSPRDVLRHLLVKEKYFAGRNLEAEYKRCVTLKDFEALSRLLAMQLKYLLREAVGILEPENSVTTQIKPEFFDCIPSNLILYEERLEYIDREWSLTRPVKFGVLLLRTVDALHNLDRNVPELSRENLLCVLARLGFAIDSCLQEEYDALIEDVVAQVYQGAYLDSAVVVQEEDTTRRSLKQLAARLQYLPKSAEELARLQSYFDQVFLAQDGISSQDYLEYVKAEQAVCDDDVQLCKAMLDIVEKDADWAEATDFILALLRIFQTKSASANCSSENPLQKFKLFEYGGQFKDFICPNPFVYAELQQGGGVSCCCYLPFSLGNLAQNTLEEIWDSVVARELRRSMLNGEFCYCDATKCATMQEALLQVKTDAYRYQLPYQLLRSEQVDDDTIRRALDTGSVAIGGGPTVISFEDDPSCNLSCPSCRTGTMSLTPEQSQQRVAATVRLLDTVGPTLQELWFSGAGDPLASAAYRSLFQEYDFERFPAVSLRLDTNGILLNQHTWDTVLGKVNHRIKLIAVSVDAATAETYVHIRRGGNFETLLQNLQFIANLPGRQTGLRFIIRMIVQQRNYQEMRQFVELGRALGVDAVVFSVMQNWGTFSAEDYERQAVHLPNHPEHEQLRQILKDPVFASPFVNLGNLLHIYAQITKADHAIAHETANAPAARSAEDFARRVRVIAFYLPQFHPVPENDLWWGKGFTEWTNVGKAQQLYEGHYQPHVPADLGYYDLRVPEVRQAQADMARQYGVEAFCYWHYWFAGKRLLERPFNEVIQSGKPDFPFCLGWANQTWSGIWHGAPDRILIEQTYPGLQDYKAHFEALLPAFCDHRYLKIGGKLMFLIYAPQNLPDARQFTDYWQELAYSAGLPGFHFVAHGVQNPAIFGCQTCVDNAPFATMQAPELSVVTRSGQKPPRVYRYEDLVAHLKGLRPASIEHPLVVPNWDNTPRSGANGLVLHGSTPELFGEMLDDAVAKAEQHPDPDRRIVFVKAWNEWAEGNYLEPDIVYGHRYLEVLRERIAGGSSLGKRTHGEY